jgi:fructosamine-3-kinase
MNEDVRRLLESVYEQPLEIRSASSVGGGCINETQVLSLSNGEKVFLKYNSQPPVNFFKREAAGLRLLAQADNGPRIPQVVGLTEDTHAHFLILEYIEQGRTGKEYPIQFARALANMHRVTRDHYGLDEDNFIGSTPQKNTPEEDGLTFFREHRLRFQQTLARERGRLPVDIDRKLDRLCDRLDQYLDLTGERPALVHGDLWSGNHFADRAGRACLVDPAAYFGLRETDLAMSELFGRLPQSFYDAYFEAFPVNTNYLQRKDIFNIYHLLNHVNLFGGSYLSSVETALNHFLG